MSSVPALDTGSAKPLILFIDDEPRVLKSMRAMFRREYDVYLANSGQDALEVIADNDIDVVVSDQRMPNMTGVEVLTEIKARCPDVIRILLTGYSDLEAIEASLNEAEVFRYLMKPSSAEEIRTAVNEGLSKCHEPTLAEVIRLPATAPAAEPAAQPEVSATPMSVRTAAPKKGSAPDIILLGSSELFAPLTKVSNAKLHCVDTLDEAVQVANNRNVGILVLDAPITDVEKLARRAHKKMPGTVTLVANDRSDAMLLIQLINQDLVFRFLVKPVQEGRLKVTLDATIQRVADAGDFTYTEEESAWTRALNWLLGR